MKRRILGAITIASTLIPITSVSCSFIELIHPSKEKVIEKAVKEYSKTHPRPEPIRYYSPSTCNDGWHSHSSGRGTCSHHGGVSHHSSFTLDSPKLVEWYNSLLKYVNKELDKNHYNDTSLFYLKNKF